MKPLRTIETALFQRPKRWLRVVRARRRRIGRLGEVTIVGVTGSAGKTTTVALLGEIISSTDRRKIGFGNWFDGLVQDVLGIRPDDGHWVQEISGHHPGAIAKAVDVIRPDIGIVTSIGTDHRSAFSGTAGIAIEKGTLVELLPATGVAILNADDPEVRGMAVRAKARVVTYGLAPDADVRGVGVTAAFPGFLALQVAARGELHPVSTGLSGAHWVTAVLAAYACGLELGFTAEDCATAIARYEPGMGRYSVHPVDGGAVYVLDSRKAPWWTVPASMAFVKTATAPRKTIVFGTISDYPGASSSRYRKAAKLALQVADRVLFVGPQAERVYRLQAHIGRDRLLTFETAAEATAHLARTQVPDELVFVKASQVADHLERLVLAQTTGVSCWVSRCGRSPGCWECRYRHTPRGKGPEAPSLAVAELAV